MHYYRETEFEITKAYLYQIEGVSHSSKMISNNS